MKGLSIVRHTIAGVLLATLGGCGGGNGNSNDFSERTLADLDATVESLYNELGVPGINAGLWVAGRGEWSRSLGVADLTTGAPYRWDQHVRIGSITKTFTVTVVLQLHDEGLLSIDDTLDRYFDTVPGSDRITLSGPIPNGDRITLRNLANMTSGLASYTFSDEFLDALFGDPQRHWDPHEPVEIALADTANGCANYPPACFEPGTDWFYSNTNTVLLGLIVEHVTGRTLGEEVESRILQPLGLDHTIWAEDASFPTPLAHGYTQQGDNPPFTDATFWNPSWGWATGNMISSMPDLRVWARALGTGALLAPATQALRQTQVDVGGHVPGVFAYALGMGYVNGWWGHAGELPGYNTVIWYRPDVDAVLVVSVNADHIPVDDGEGGVVEVSPAQVIADALVDIANREMPLGDLSGEVPFIDVVIPED